jgi:hypothetical protein
MSVINIPENVSVISIFLSRPQVISIRKTIMKNKIKPIYLWQLVFFW